MRPLALLAPADLGTRILDLLFPPRCVGCKSFGAWLCEQCLDLIPRVAPPFCIHCGGPVEKTASRLCTRCRTAPLQIDRIRSAVYFEGTLREAVHKFKYDGVTALAEPLGGLLAEYWSQHPIPVDVLVPVPLHRSRVRERGFNQAALLAQQLSKRVHLALDGHTLVRQRATASQVELNTEERKENVRDAFRCTTGALVDSRVLLIDDVCTTGSTLEACAVALRDGGAKSVQALTLSRARR
ncbi:MAG: ComF family protein [Anaerolineae bacterium]